MPSRRSWFERHPKGTIAGVLLALFGLLTLLTRPLIPTSLTVPNPHYHHGLKPNRQATITWGNRAYVLTTNSMGFKDRAVREVPLRSDKYRLLFLGDSFTEGIGLPYEKTFVGLIEQALDTSRYEVLNAGVSSYSPRLYYHKLRHLVDEVGLHVDEVRVYLDISDVQDEVIYQAYEPGALSLRQRLDHLLTRNVHAYYAVKKSFKVFRQHDPFYTARGHWTHDADAFAAWGRHGLTLAHENMDRLYRLCEARGIALVIAVYPWPAQIEQPSATVDPVAVWRAFARERGIRLVNYFPHFVDEQVAGDIVETHFAEDNRHWNEAGHALIARHAGLPEESPPAAAPAQTTALRPGRSNASPGGPR